MDDIVKVVIPEHDKSSSHFYVDDDGGMSKHDPRQPVLEGVSS